MFNAAVANTMKLRSLALLAALVCAPSAFAAAAASGNKCYTGKQGSQTINLFWSQEQGRFSQLHLIGQERKTLFSAPTQRDAMSVLNCSQSAAATCQLEDEGGRLQFVKHDGLMTVTVDGTLGMTRTGEDESGLAVIPGMRVNIPLKQMADADCKRLFPADTGQIQMFPHGADKWDMPSPAEGGGDDGTDGAK